MLIMNILTAGYPAGKAVQEEARIFSVNSP